MQGDISARWDAIKRVIRRSTRVPHIFLGKPKTNLKESRLPVFFRAVQQFPWIITSPPPPPLHPLEIIRSRRLLLTAWRNKCLSYTFGPVCASRRTPLRFETFRRAESRWGAAGAARGMPSYVAGKVDGTTLTRSARNRVNRFPGNVQARDTRAPRTRAYRRLQGKERERIRENERKKEKRSFEHIGDRCEQYRAPW